MQFQKNLFTSTWNYCYSLFLFYIFYTDRSIILDFTLNSGENKKLEECESNMKNIFFLSILYP